MKKRSEKIIAITYANEKYAKAAKLNVKTAKRTGKVDMALVYSPKDIEESFKKNHETILGYEKGNGYWLWKPYFIKRTLESMNEGEILIYTDSTIIYKEEAKKLVNAMEESHVDKMVFLLGKEYVDANYTKRDTFILMESDEEKYYATPQVNAAMIVFRKNEANMEFCAEWLKYASDERILTDIPNTCGKENYPGFLVHRHDQSVLSLLAKRHDSVFFVDPSQWGGGESDYSIEIKERSNYPCIFNHHRIPNASSILYIMFMQTAVVQKVIYKKYIRQERKRKYHKKCPMSDRA